MKAAWALGRLVSPGQPENWQTNIKEAETTASLVLDKLFNDTTEPQVALELLGCLSHCLAWKVLGNQISENITERVKRLSDTTLPVEAYLPNYPKIESVFYERLYLLPKMLEIDQASAQEVTQMETLLLESVKNRL